MVRRICLIRCGIVCALACACVVARARVLHAQSIAAHDVDPSVRPILPTQAESVAVTTAVSFLPAVLGPIVVPPFEVLPALKSEPRGVSVPTAGTMAAPAISAPNTSVRQFSLRDRQDENTRENRSARDEPAPRRSVEPLARLNQNAP